MLPWHSITNKLLSGLVLQDSATLGLHCLSYEPASTIEPSGLINMLVL